MSIIWKKLFWVRVFFGFLFVGIGFYLSVKAISYDQIATSDLNENITLSYAFKDNNILFNEEYDLTYINSSCDSLSLIKSKNNLNVTCYINNEKNIEVLHELSSELIIGKSKLIDNRTTKLFIVSNTYLKYFKY